MLLSHRKKKITALLPFFKMNLTPMLLPAAPSKSEWTKSSSTKFYWDIYRSYRTYFFVNGIYFPTTPLHTFHSWHFWFYLGQLKFQLFNSGQNLTLRIVLSDKNKESVIRKDEFVSLHQIPKVWEQTRLIQSSVIHHDRHCELAVPWACYLRHT